MFKTGNYKEEFAAVIDQVWKEPRMTVEVLGEGFVTWVQFDLTKRESRMIALDHFIELYMRETGERPDSKELDRLADFCLREELTDRNPYKMSHDEFPIMSSHQVALRRDRSAPMIAAATVGSDKADHRKPIRKNITTKRMIWLDEKTRIQNKERRDRYKRDTAPGEIISYVIGARA